MWLHHGCCSARSARPVRPPRPGPGRVAPRHPRAWKPGRRSRWPGPSGRTAWPPASPPPTSRSSSTASAAPPSAPRLVRAHRLAQGIALADVVAQVRARYVNEGRTAPRFSETLLSSYEGGQKRPGPEYLHYLCCVYQAEPADLGYESPCLCGQGIVPRYSCCRGPSPPANRSRAGPGPRGSAARTRPAPPATPPPILTAVPCPPEADPAEPGRPDPGPPSRARSGCPPRNCPGWSHPGRRPGPLRPAPRPGGPRHLAAAGSRRVSAGPLSLGGVTTARAGACAGAGLARVRARPVPACPPRPLLRSPIPPAEHGRDGRRRGAAHAAAPDGGSRGPRRRPVLRRHRADPPPAGRGAARCDRLGGDAGPLGGDDRRVRPPVHDGAAHAAALRRAPRSR